jgi:cobalt-precorrin 5A hydrolase
MVRGKAMIVAGLGCRNECDAGEILRLIDRALHQTGVPMTALAALATAAFKAEAEAPRAASEALKLPLLLIDDAKLEAASARAVTRSAAALRATGLMAIAEGAALAAAGDGSVLILPRIKGACATCALARGLTR